MKISIIIAYYNRRNLLLKTLESMCNTRYKNLEVIIVDDASISSQSISDTPVMFPNLNIKVVRIEPVDKWWVNPCMPNNIGFAVATGDIIIIQNPECLHIGDIVSHAVANMTANKYIAYGCYALDHSKTKQIAHVNGGDTEAINNVIQPTNDILLDQCPHMNRWYQHSIYSDRCLNFCTAITREDLEDLGGFDEEYALGISYDDTEFIARIKKKGMNVSMVDIPMVIHQCHGYTDYSNKLLVQRNTDLYYNTLKSDNFRVDNVRTKTLIGGLLK